MLSLSCVVCSVSHCSLLMYEQNVNEFVNILQFVWLFHCRIQNWERGRVRRSRICNDDEDGGCRPEYCYRCDCTRLPGTHMHRLFVLFLISKTVALCKKEEKRQAGSWHSFSLEAEMTPGP
jgi:hypothetical protein